MSRESFSNSSVDGRTVPASSDGSDVAWGGETGRRWRQVADRVETQSVPGQAVRATVLEELRPRHDGTGVRMSGAIAVVSARRP
jgi:hypothetical protein